MYWCSGRDLNPHAFRHMPLKHAFSAVLQGILYAVDTVLTFRLYLPQRITTHRHTAEKTR